jgi:hypothetical protein
MRDTHTHAENEKMHAAVMDAARRKYEAAVTDGEDARRQVAEMGPHIVKLAERAREAGLALRAADERLRSRDGDVAAAREGLARAVDEGVRSDRARLGLEERCRALEAANLRLTVELQRHMARVGGTALGYVESWRGVELGGRGSVGSGGAGSADALAPADGDTASGARLGGGGAEPGSDSGADFGGGTVSQLGDGGGGGGGSGGGGGGLGGRGLGVTPSMDTLMLTGTVSGPSNAIGLPPPPRAPPMGPLGGAQRDVVAHPPPRALRRREGGGGRHHGRAAGDDMLGSVARGGGGGGASAAAAAPRARGGGASSGPPRGKAAGQQQPRTSSGRKALGASATAPALLPAL